MAYFSTHPRRSGRGGLLVALAIAASGAVACGGETAAAPPPATPAAPAPEPTKPPPPPIPVAVPEVSPTPESCAAFTGSPEAKTDAKAGVCADAKSVLAALATAALAERSGDRAGRDAALAPLSSCDRVPARLVETLRAELAPAACAEAIVAPAIEARGKEALPPHLAAARALVGASRLARMRPKKGDFDALARAEVDPAAADAGVASVVAWKDALEKQETEALGLSKSAPAEIAAVVRFEAAAAWLAFAQELRGTPLPPDLKPLVAKDPDLETRYFAKLDEVTMPILERARGLALAGLGMGLRDGVLLKDLPSFRAIVEPFKSRPGFEHRETRDLDLLAPDPLAGSPSDATKIAAALPPWAVYAALERAAPAELLSPDVLVALAAHRGIPSALRVEAEKGAAKPKGAGKQAAKPDPAIASAVALSRLRVALAYGSRPDAEAVAGLAAKTPADTLRVAVAKALLGTPADPKAKPIAAKPGYALEHLDALAKKPGALGHAAAYDAALLSLDAAQVFGGDPTDPLQTTTDPRKAYEEAIARLDAVAARKDLDPARAANAKRLSQSARESVKLLEKPTPKQP